MATIDQFAKGWTRKNNPRDNPLDQDIFPDEATLLIGIADEERTRCNVAWLDLEGRWWSIQGLPFEDGKLAADEIRVTSEATGQSYQRSVDIRLDSTPGETVITGNFRHVDGPVDGPVGTFTAEASSKGDCVDVTRLEESIAV